MKKVFMLTICAALILMTNCALAADSKVSTISLESSSLEITAPFELTEDKKGTGKEITYSGKGNGIMMMVFGVSYNAEELKSKFGEVNNSDIEKALLETLVNEKDIARMDPIKDVKVDGVSGKEITGAMNLQADDKDKSKNIEFRMTAFTKDEKFWLVAVFREPTNETQAVSDKIFSSIKVK